MKNILFFLLAVLFLFSCNYKKEKVYYECTIKSVKEKPKISIHDQMNRTKYIVTTSCGKRSFSVYRKYNIGDTITLTKVIVK